jgi:hypothetical protein
LLSFNHYQRAIPLFESYSGDVTSISKTAFDRIVSDAANEYTILIPSPKESLVPVRAFFKEEQQGIYLLAATNKANEKFRAILCTKKPHQTSIEYKNLINEAIRTFPSLSIAYRSPSEVKVVLQGKLYLPEETDIGGVLSTHFRKVKIHGIEFPLNEDNQQKYREEGIMFYPLTDRDRKYSISWKQV